MRPLKAYLLLTLTCLLPCCSREEAPGPHPFGMKVEQEVCLFLEVAPEEGTTRSQYTPVDEPSGKVSIQNLWVLQFDGTSDDALLARVPTYLPGFTSGITSCKLIVDLGHASTLVFLANTFQPVLSLGVEGQTSLGEFKKKYLPVLEESDLFGASGGSYYQRLNGSATATITQSTTAVGTALAQIPLKRSMARLDIALKSDNPGITLSRIQLCNVPKRDYLLTNYGLSAPFPLTSLQVTDYEADAMSSGEDVAGGYKLFRHYVSANLRGVGLAETPGAKNSEAPEGATYLRVDGTFGGNPVHYFFYLGGNFGGESAGDKTDFNLLPNHRYTYQITISSVPSDDDRVEYYGDVDFSGSERANSYMLHVPRESSEVITFTIPVEKPDLFWGDPQYSVMPFIDNGSNELEVRRYEDNTYRASDMLLGTDGIWTAELLWSDFPITDSEVQLSADNGSTWGLAQTCSDANKGKDGSFQIKVKGGVKGNFSVGLRKNLNYTKDGSPGTLQCYIWSWHFWVTDYNPDQIRDASPSGFFYKVRGGKLVRYDTMAKFLMDRPLGATYRTPQPELRTSIAESSVTHDATTGLFYQFGRKDPFPNNRAIYIKGSATATYGLSDINNKAAAEATLLTDTRFSKVHRGNLTSTWTGLLYTINKRINVPFSINHPMTFIYGSEDYWNGGQGAYDDYFNPKADGINYWMDPKASGRDDPKLGKNKSVFDPCPPGWRVHSSAVNTSSWVLDKHISAADYVTPMQEVYHYGSYLWPEEMPASITESDLDRSILYVYEGYLLCTTGTLSSVWNTQNDLQSHTWTAVRTSNSRAYSLSVMPSSFVAAPHLQAQGYNVRCEKY